MPIRIKANVEPFSAQAQPELTLVEPILASSQASRLLEHELRRYCRGEVRGRSFLVAGHRGSGKTTMVDNALLRVQRHALKGDDGIQLKPLPVYLLGPTLLDDERLEDKHGKNPSEKTTPAPKLAVNIAGTSLSVPAAGPPPVEDELMHRVLIEVVLGLHLAMSREFVGRFHDRATQLGLGELLAVAAQFEIELTESPPPSRLREFWRMADALDDGVLFDSGTPRRGQGLRELVALNGISHAHERVSGELREQDDRRTGRSIETASAVGADAKGTDIFKPIAAVASGAAVASASAAGGGTATAIVLGVLTAFVASLFLRFSTATQVRRERKVDRTFIPDLSIKTLHRLIPELLFRMKEARLAPVFIIDELDKVDDLSIRIYPLIRTLKKLFAETSFTCLLVDRGFYENLLVREEMELRGEHPSRHRGPRRAASQ